MSWLRSAVYRAVEAGGNNNITRSVRSYADSVVNQAGQAVADETCFDLQAAKNLQSFKQAVKRLEEVSVSNRGLERVQLLRRWLAALKEVEQLSNGNADASRKSSELHISDESNVSPKKPTLVLYYDIDIGVEPVNFRDVFLHSRAVEGMTQSIILEMPNEEESSLLLEIFGLCLTGGKEVHKTILSCIKDLSKAFSSYEEEVLVKREEFLQYAQSAIGGLKINAEISRIDSEASNILNNLDGLKLLHERLSEKPVVLVEDPKQTLERIRLCSRLESLLLKKKHLNYGETYEVHAMKVEKLKVLSESLANSALKAKSRISEHSSQKEEAMNFRKAKYKEVVEIEKVLCAEIGELEKQKYKLEMELKKVNDSVAVACARLRNAREEKLQFDEASNQIVKHFETKADEVSKSITCYRTEADVCIAFINFLEETWGFQASYIEHKKKQVKYVFFIFPIFRLS
ncbi:uncharacterized protein LOC124938915 [Impatiens glandulifera]|uniref:uncharacterized protein LOC124938915 n=1 Tax=Impatiens glandulifera TaxID=253017 RepID=UPI001FB0B085|nr:uncharacterized protein LOC124938915 [Impatiens glandulifera]